MELRFDDDVVLVTGASTGIGAAVARGFGAAGATVAVHYNRSAEEAERVVAGVLEAGGKGEAFQADLSRPGQASDLVAAVVDRFSRVDVLVNNAGGLIERRPVAEAPDELYDEIMNLNVRATFEACRAVLPGMRARGGGTIVNVSSVAARNGGGPGSVLYASGKAAVSTFTRGLAKEVAGENIRVNALSPGLIATPFHDRYTDPDAFEAMIGGIPMGRAGQPEDCVGPTLFLASDAAAGFVTGQMLEVNGGQLMP